MPSITAEQPTIDLAASRERNRQRANEARIAHSRTKRWIAAPAKLAESRERAAEVLLDPPPLAASMRVFDVLCAAHRTGPVWTRRVLGTHRIYERKAVGQLTLRQAMVLAGALRNEDREQLEIGGAR